MKGATDAPIIADGLRLDADAAAGAIEEFVRREVARRGRQGVVLGLSGGLDSSVCAYLCARALGKERVLTYILPERHSSVQNMRDAELVAETLGLEPTRIDLTPILTQIGTYELTPGHPSPAKRVIRAARRRLRGAPSALPAYSETMVELYGTQVEREGSSRNRQRWQAVCRNHAFMLGKLRLRMIMLYHHAALNNCLVAGTLDKSEWSIGFYDRYGDGACDLALLVHLYKTQIRALARHLGLPPRIVTKPSSGDLFRGTPNEALIGMSYEQLDAVLWGLERGLPEEEICMQVGVGLARVEEVRRAAQATRARDDLPAHL
ncbi:MAG: NAD(+) synthase [Anaerolineales bacterium]|nr:MAG: NAD(+) synthase [Anaerolineales bacterium]